ncbi:TetR/AcrR family transcriptional regulator [Nocardia cerradoensis]|uniref:TetR/AcrR family transcriptional regulator n=1 Tax=Nocardia cerradoensis TaxID=85688 RepID=UPI000301CB6C|nr:TetR/AcrR family transcriptional regulator [Nocardia cerradoensis]NKY45624.1 TetR/AcrR family transcriptional regulator [Nocardia cerradoensis]
MPATLSAERNASDRAALLDAAEELMYAHGVQAVGMDRIRAASGLSLKRIYALYPTKDDLVVAMLRRRDERWRQALAGYVERVDDPIRRVEAVFHWLRDWFGEQGFRGCAWINMHGELGAESPAVRAEVRAHKAAFHDMIAGWVGATGSDAADAIYLLAEGAIVTAGITGGTAAASTAEVAAAQLLSTARHRA